MKYSHLLPPAPTWYAALLVGAILLLPITHPFFTVQETEDNDQVTRVDRENTVTQTVELPAGTITGLVFWLQENRPVPADKSVTVTLTNQDTQETHATTVPLNNAYNAQRRRLTLSIPDLTVSRPTSFEIAVTAPEIGEEEQLRFRQPDAAEGSTVPPLAFQLLTTRPLFRVTLDTIGGTLVEGHDIYYYWHRGGLIVEDINPYSCAKDDTCINQKNPGHFPLFYWLAAATRAAGLEEFPEWIAFWRPVFLGVYVGIGALLFGVFSYRRQYALAVFAALLWLGNRWSLYVASIAQIDFIALFLLLLSLVTFRRWWWLSLLLFGASLATKQVAIFLVPLYLIAVWQQVATAPVKQQVWRVVIASLLLGIIPLLALAPFLISDAAGVATGLLFSATRSNEANLGAPALGALLNGSGSLNTLSLLVVMAGVYTVAWRLKLPLVISGLLVFISFVSFNTVLFNQYLVWLIPFAPLAASEYVTQRQKLL